jgi:type IV pilus assembly protein PilQ
MKNSKCNKLIDSFLFILCLFFVLLFFSPQISARVSSDWKNIIFDQEMSRISMDFKDADLKDVLKVFSQQAKLNFVASKEVEGRKITLYLQDVPVDEALEKILEANNLNYEKDDDSDIFIVKGVTEPEIATMTKVFYLKYARVSSSRLNSEIKDKFKGSGAETSGAGTNDITGAITKILSANGRVVEDSRTNSLIVTDSPNRFPIIENTIARLDISIPQVMIEIEILDVNKNVLDQMGVKFSDTVLQYTGPSRETVFPLDRKMLENATSQVTHFGKMSAESLTATLQLLSTHTDTKYLARPRLVTLSNETSEIKIAVNEAVGVTTETVATGGATGTVTQSAERYETGISLRVTPQVNIENRDITMFLETSVTQAKAGTITLQGNTLKDPETRGTKSTVMVPDGETIVIGGLIRTDDSQVKKKIPILGDIPFFGAAFRYREGNTQNRELIVFITPHISTGDGFSSASNNTTSTFLESEREQGPLTSLSDEVDKALSEVEKRNSKL